MKQYLQEPLIYFLLIGGLFFIAFDYFDQSYVSDEQTIKVDRISLLKFMQRKTKAVDQTRLVKAYDGMPADKKQKLIDAYVREQALYRESNALGLNKGDPIIKARAIQNLEFITQEYSEALLKVTDEQLESYFSEHKDNYYVEAFVTFTHVFFDSETNGKATAEKLANEKLIELNKNKVSFSEGIQHGNRFPYHVNYVERTPDFVASHFGQSMADSVFAMASSDEQQWQGPYESHYGYHLVMLSRHEEGRYPELVDVVGQVYQDAQRVQIRENLDKTYQAIIDTYHVELKDDINLNIAEQKQTVEKDSNVNSGLSMNQATQ